MGGNYNKRKSCPKHRHRSNKNGSYSKPQLRPKKNKCCSKHRFKSNKNKSCSKPRLRSNKNTSCSNLWLNTPYLFNKRWNIATQFNETIYKNKKIRKMEKLGIFFPPKKN